MSKHSKKQLAADKAVAHVADMATRFPNEIMHSVERTCMYESAPRVKVASDAHTKVDVIATDTVSAIYDHTDNGEKVAILNFASYLNPGGGYINGAWAQEEALCAESTLYPILELNSRYYEKNRRDKNEGAYTSRSLLVPNVIFERERNARLVDVIVSAAPNARHMGPERADEAAQALRDRIDMVCRIAADSDCDTFIAGAWGCGVFGNDPESVAEMFKDWLDENDGAIPRVVFAIMNADSDNYKAFADIFA